MTQVKIQYSCFQAISSHFSLFIWFKHPFMQNNRPLDMAAQGIQTQRSKTANEIQCTHNSYIASQKGYIEKHIVTQTMQTGNITSVVRVIWLICLTKCSWNRPL
jgi:predicted ATP-binding protein involved in virulence